MPLPEYVLLASLATGIQAPGGADGILPLGPEAITQPNGGAPGGFCDVVKRTLITGPKYHPNAAVTGRALPKVDVTVTPPAHGYIIKTPIVNPTIRAPLIRTPVVR